MLHRELWMTGANRALAGNYCNNDGSNIDVYLLALSITGNDLLPLNLLPKDLLMSKVYLYQPGNC